MHFHLLTGLFLYSLLSVWSHVHCVDSEVDSTDSIHVAEDTEEDGSTPSVFQPTREWKTIEKGQSIPAGLHVRMNLQTGVREAKLMDEDDGVSGGDRSISVVQLKESGHEFTGDQRRTHHHGYSDRRGIVNKRTKVFTRQEYLDMMRDKEQLNFDPSNIPALTGHTSVEGTFSSAHHPHQHAHHPHQHNLNNEEANVRLPVTIHSDISAMLSLSQTLGNRTSSVPGLVAALDKLEDYVHQIDNAHDLNAVGGLVLVVRLLNHSSPDVRSSAAGVIGSATQSNPVVQKDVFQYGGLQLLCSLIGHSQPDIVQRRGLFALGALLRGDTDYQDEFARSCKGFHGLGETFSKRSDIVKVKAVTLLMDFITEQTSTASTNQLSVLEEGNWCSHVSSLIHSDEPRMVERGLEAMLLLQEMCDFTPDTSKLKLLTQQLGTDSDGYNVTLLELCQLILKTLRQQNKEL